MRGAGFLLLKARRKNVSSRDAGLCYTTDSELHSTGWIQTKKKKKGLDCPQSSLRLRLNEAVLNRNDFSLYFTQSLFLLISILWGRTTTA